MTHSGPLPDYTRPTNIYGWPTQHHPPTWDATADRVIVSRWWQHVARSVLVTINDGATFDAAPLGTFNQYRIEREQFVNPKTGDICPRRNLCQANYRASDYLRDVVAGRPTPGVDWWSADLDAAARSMPITPDMAKAIWTLQAAKIINNVARNNSFAARGFGTFYLFRRYTRRYRNWRTGLLAYAPTITRPTWRPSPQIKEWLTAGVIPPAVG